MRPAKYLKQPQIDLKETINNSIIIMGYLNTILSPLDKPTMLKLNKDIWALREEMEESGLVDICRGLFIHKKLNIHSSPIHMGHPPK